MGGGKAAIVLAAAILACWPLSVAAVAGTVDHPAVDGVDAFDNGPRDSGAVALTFDADLSWTMLRQLQAGRVSSWYNREVREILDAERVPATIFLTGLWTSTYPAEARSLAADPLFEIGSHGFSHSAFRTPCYGLPVAVDRSAELAGAQEEIRTVTGVTPRLFRFPGDCYARADLELARQHGLKVISGDVRAGDGFNWSADSVAGNVLRSLRPGSIVVMHLHGAPNAPMTAPALRQIIPEARRRGLHFETVSRLLKLGAAAPAAGHLERVPKPPAVIGVLERLDGGRLELSAEGARLAHVHSSAWSLRWLPQRSRPPSAWEEHLRHWPPPARSGAGVGWTGD